MAERIVGFGYYRIVEEIGEGGFGTVYKAVHRLLEQPVALKSLHQFLTKEPRFKERFFREAEIQAKLKHQNIVSIHNFFYEEGVYFIVMEFVEGMVLPNNQAVRTLADLIKFGPLAEEKVLPIAKQVLEAVSYAHNLGILHLDIKPSNILFTPTGEVKVADFGIARIVSGERAGLASEVRVGTAPYMSPEQILNKQLDKTSDIYSLGITFYEMLTGEVPFRRTADSSIEEQHLFSPPPKLREKNPKVSPLWERIIEKALAKKPLDRFPSCEELLQALTQPVTGEEVRVEKPKTITCPSLIGKTKGEGAGLCQEKNLVLVVEGEESSEIIPAGKILWQSPEPGTLLGEGDSVKVVVSKGKEEKLITVPFLIGKGRKEIEGILGGLGLKLVVSGEEYSEEIPSGSVIKQDPSAGKEVRKGEVIKVFLSKGAKPPVVKLVKVPVLIGKERKEAERLVSQGKLKLVVEKEEHSETIKDGCILSQSPEPGSELREGSEVRVVLSKGIPKVLVPKLIGRTKEEAEGLLSQVGLGLVVEGEDYSETILSGRVLRQIPEPEQALGRGSLVKVVLSKGRKVVEVPSLIGNELKSAERILTNLGLRLVLEREEYSKEMPLMSIIRQNPPPGEKLKLGGEVRVIVSKGKKLIKVPILIDKSLDEAEKVAFQLGLKVIAEGWEYSNIIPKGRVIRQVPEAEESIAEDGVIRVILSKGKEVYKLPPLVGKTIEEAEKALAGMGLKLVVEWEDYSEDIPQGCIISQTPEAGEDLHEGETVRVILSQGKKPVVKRVIVVPKLVGRSKKEAEAITNNLGLKLVIEGEEYSEKFLKDFVTKQSPLAGESIEDGEVVRVTLSKGKESVEVRKELAKPPLIPLAKGIPKIVLILVGLTVVFGLGIYLGVRILSKPKPTVPAVGVKPETLATQLPPPIPETVAPPRERPEAITPRPETIARRARPETIPPVERPKVETVSIKPVPETTPAPPIETAPAKPESAQIVPYAKVEVRPNPIHIPTPHYPELAQRAKIEGQTIVRVLLDTNGSVISAEVWKSSGNTALDESALEAARQAKFTPAKQKEIPVKVWVSIPFNFRLKK